uniref:PRA1 family protein n=1 Tax=Elaeis guineensis var. tenera TaxID=51953 RepID=A0A6I9S5P1_ELAGV|nr:PRA1 family protein B4-like [Elaeis guineensis]
MEHQWLIRIQYTRKGTQDIIDDKQSQPDSVRQRPRSLALLESASAQNYKQNSAKSSHCNHIDVCGRKEITGSSDIKHKALGIRVRSFAYFHVNYIALFALSLVSHPFSLLILLGLLAAWCFLYLFCPANQPLVLFGRTFSNHETLGSLVLLSIFVIFLTSIRSLLISALMVGITIVCAHGTFRVPEDLFQILMGQRKGRWLRAATG